MKILTEEEQRRVTSSNLKRLLKEKNVSAAEVGRQLHVSESTARSWFSGARYPRLKQLQALADYFNVTRSEIEGTGTKPNNLIPDNIETEVVKIPIIGKIACGKPIMSEENIIGYEEEPASTAGNGECFYLQTEGDSMVPTVPVGARVKIRIQPDVESGEIAAVNINGELTLKRVKKSGDSIMLIPDNRQYDPIILHRDDYNRIIGKAIKVSFDL